MAGQPRPRSRTEINPDELGELLEERNRRADGGEVADRRNAGESAAIESFATSGK